MLDQKKIVSLFIANFFYNSVKIMKFQFKQKFHSITDGDLKSDTMFKVEKNMSKIYLKNLY